MMGPETRESQILSLPSKAATQSTNSRRTNYAQTFEDIPPRFPSSNERKQRREKILPWHRKKNPTAKNYFHKGPRTGKKEREREILKIESARI